MKQATMATIACLAGLSSVGASSAVADDRELQAILAKQGCVPGSTNQTELSPAVTAYEVTCRGSGRVLTIVCVDTNCRLQPKPQDN